MSSGGKLGSAIMTTDERIGAIEGRVEEQAAAIADLRIDRRESSDALRDGLRQVNARIDAVNSRIDRIFLAMLGIGAAQIALLLTLTIRT